MILSFHMISKLHSHIITVNYLTTYSCNVERTCSKIEKLIVASQCQILFFVDFFNLVKINFSEKYRFFKFFTKLISMNPFMPVNSENYRN